MFGSLLLLVVLLLCSSSMRTWLGWPDLVGWIAGGLLVAGLALSYVWHRARPVRSHAWGGAGPAVLLGAAVWVALLFTTAGVVLAADWLNGGEQSVANLAATHTVEGPIEPLPPQRAEDQEVPVPTPGLRLRATGDVVIEEARVLVSQDDGVVTVVSGRVHVASAYREAQRAQADPAVSNAVPSLNLSSATIRVSEEPVALRSAHICRGVPDRSPTEPAGACVPRSTSFVQDGVVSIRAGELVVDSADAPVLLIVDNPPQAVIVVPQVLIWAAMVLPAWLVVVVGIAVACYITLRTRAGAAVDKQLGKDKIGPRDRQAAHGARMTAAFTHRAERLVGFVGAVTALTLLAILVTGSSGVAPWEQDDRLTPWARLGLWTAVGLSTLVVLAAAQMRRSEATRRGVGVLWDLTTFWPRVAHPLGPPCYAERVVPEVRCRVDWVLDGGPRARVILSGHSQGALIAVAVVARLGSRRVPRVRLITYGSQLRTWYGRTFPDVFGPRALGHEPLDAVARFGSAAPDAPDAGDTNAAPPFSSALPETSIGRCLGVDTAKPRWVNLFRRSDPLGFRVFSDEQSRIDVYVPEVPPPAHGDPGPRVQTHSNYQFTEAYRRVVQPWFDTGVPDGPRSRVSKADFMINLP
jgi:hypothetical protein